MVASLAVHCFGARKSEVIVKLKVFILVFVSLGYGLYAADVAKKSEAAPASSVDDSGLVAERVEMFFKSVYTPHESSSKGSWEEVKHDLAKYPLNRAAVLRCHGLWREFFTEAEDLLEYHIEQGPEAGDAPSVVWDTIKFGLWFVVVHRTNEEVLSDLSSQVKSCVAAVHGTCGESAAGLVPRLYRWFACALCLLEGAGQFHRKVLETGISQISLEICEDPYLRGSAEKRRVVYSVLKALVCPKAQEAALRDELLKSIGMFDWGASPSVV